MKSKVLYKCLAYKMYAISESWTQNPGLQDQCSSTELHMLMYYHK